MNQEAIKEPQRWEMRKAKKRSLLHFRWLLSLLFKDKDNHENLQQRKSLHLYPSLISVWKGPKPGWISTCNYQGSHAVKLSTLQVHWKNDVTWLNWVQGFKVGPGEGPETQSGRCSKKKKKPYRPILTLTVHRGASSDNASEPFSCWPYSLFPSICSKAEVLNGGPWISSNRELVLKCNYQASSQTHQLGTQGVKAIDLCYNKPRGCLLVWEPLL